MAKTLLQQLYDGEIYPSEQIFLQGKKHKELNQKICEEVEKFKGLLSPEEWKRFEVLDDMRHERSGAYCCANFMCGFRLGVGLMVEALAADVEHPKE